MKQPSYLDSLPLATSEVSSVKSETDSPAKKPETGLEAGKTVTSYLDSSFVSSDSPESPKLQDPLGKQPELELSAAEQRPANEGTEVSLDAVGVEPEEGWGKMLLAVGAALLGGVLLLKLLQG